MRKVGVDIHGVEICAAPHLVRGRTIENVANEPMDMRGHCYEIDVFLTRQLDDFIRRLPKGKNSSTSKPLGGQLMGALFKISSVLLHLLAFGEFELIEV